MLTEQETSADLDTDAEDQRTFHMLTDSQT